MMAKTPTPKGEGLETAGKLFQRPSSLLIYRAQWLAAHCALSIETAAILAALAWGAQRHG
jgi:hypothetical protein